MADRVLLSATDRNIEGCVRLAQEKGLGIEVMAFAFPDVLDGDWAGLLPRYRSLLRDVPGKLSMHGPFMDMAPGSPDRRINQIVTERYQHAIRIGAELGIELVVFHANFIALIHTLEYRMGWHNRNVYFWGSLADYARQYGLTIAVENAWEFDPTIIGDVVKEIAHPNLRCCLDVGHAHLFSAMPLEDWLNALNSMIAHIHLNNNDGKIDIHMGLAHGVMDMHKVLKQLRVLPSQPSITLEMDEVDFMIESLPFLELAEPEVASTPTHTPSPDV